MTTPARSSELVLPPQVWRGRELAQAQESTLPSGHAALDAQLPGGGWPLGSLVEVLQQEQQQHVWQLVGPALAQAMQAHGEPAVLVNAPYQPFGPALRALGLVPERLLCVQAEKPAARLWATEQSLHCADVCAVLAWLPQARSEELRRLHLCAQATEKLLVVFRPVLARSQSSPARLRLLVQGAEELEVRIVKRRGPPLLQPLSLQAQPARLSALLAARKSRRTVPAALPQWSGSHVLDRTASLAG
ncbi:translesion DNA synthesis-associated protein ImuA [Ramlibacter alkalitolerans]|uniref:Translesion DNA synthesis-associated protein ImuA n=1 Tax=Ramlibacter alkalitolerans TaxID=2039631 RepID=A0ABS1JNM2_9BURK|nr:translesion DNA synthesis-associated protein ImuA [Ramlibacter alkalitolerans]MBL0425855.1 translesion DNA synthesis-associated protein ImuA [Ramlibacter alkalitolerans]